MRLGRNSRWYFIRVHTVHSVHGFGQKSAWYAGLKAWECAHAYKRLFESCKGVSMTNNHEPPLRAVGLWGMLLHRPIGYIKEMDGMDGMDPDSTVNFTPGCYPEPRTLKPEP